MLMGPACKRAPMDRVEEIRDQLAGDSPRWDGKLPACAAASCANDIAAAIGGAFDDKKPDQISAAVVAVIVGRDVKGSVLGSPDVWLTAMRKAKGPGADAMRLAVAREMSLVADKHAHAIDTDADARAFVASIAGAIPGACKTYASLGAGDKVDAMPPADSPDHSACVQHDLSRRDGPGPTYGEGLFRGVAGGLALWKDALAALHEGSGQMDAKYKHALDLRIAILDAATPKIVPKSVAAPIGNTWGQMIDEHNTKLGAPDGGTRVIPDGGTRFVIPDGGKP